MRTLAGVAVIVVIAAGLAFQLSAQDSAVAPGPANAMTTVVVEGPEEWVDTGVVVQKGDMLSVSASGWIIATGLGRNNWAFGPWNPEGRDPDGGVSTREQGIFHLQAKVGETVFRVGSNWTGTAADSGTLYLGMADVPGTHFDNHGVWVVRVSGGRRAPGAA